MDPKEEEESPWYMCDLPQDEHVRRADENRASPSSTERPGILPPTTKSLSDLREAFLGVFRFAPLLVDEGPPRINLKRELLRPIPGNDFPNAPSTAHDGVPCLDSLQLDEGDSGVGIHDNPNTTEKASTTSNQPGIAMFIRQFWPDSSDSTMKREMVGPLFESHECMGYDMMSWLACQKLSNEEVVLTLISKTSNGTYVPYLGKQSRVLVPKSSARHEDDVVALISPDMSVRSLLPSGQIWSFIPSGPWVMSLATIASIMCLLSHPDKPSLAATDCPDRDMMWCFDSLQAFCRFENPEETKPPISYSLGTYVDTWMYLHFIAHSYCMVDEGRWSSEFEHSKDPGMRANRRIVTVSGVGTFRESRVWVAVRTATGDSGSDEPSPSDVAVIVSDYGHRPLNLEGLHWRERGIVGYSQSKGVALFLMLVWNQLDTWFNEWKVCIDSLDRMLEVKWEHLASHTKLLDMMECRNRSSESFNMLQTLSVFRREIGLTPWTLKRMHDEWKSTYGGHIRVDSPRFRESRVAQTLDESWDRLLGHMNQSYDSLITKVKEKETHLRSLRADPTDGPLREIKVLRATMRKSEERKRAERIGNAGSLWK